MASQNWDKFKECDNSHGIQLNSMELFYTERLFMEKTLRAEVFLNCMIREK